MRMGRRVALLALGAVTLACGGDDGGGGPDLAIAEAPTNSGEGQSGTALTTLNDSIRVQVTRNGQPEAGLTVTFATNVVGGSVSPTNPVTDANGIASAAWTVGAVSGTQLASARLSGAAGSPVFFNATVSDGSGASFGNTFFRSNRNHTTNPAVDTIFTGTTYKWWGSGGSHSVRSQGTPSFNDSNPLNGSDTYQVTFNVAGTYEYDCGVHGNAMTGTVVVLDP